MIWLYRRPGDPDGPFYEIKRQNYDGRIKYHVQRGYRVRVIDMSDLGDGRWSYSIQNPGSRPGFVSFDKALDAACDAIDAHLAKDRRGPGRDRRGRKTVGPVGPRQIRPYQRNPTFQGVSRMGPTAPQPPIETQDGFDLYRSKNVPIKAWTRGVQFDGKALQQVINTANMPFIHRHVAIMPDVHWGLGATIGSVIATKDAVMPACVGVDIGCGVMAARITDQPLDDRWPEVRARIEDRVPHGRTNRGGRGDKGAWADPPKDVMDHWMGRKNRHVYLKRQAVKLANRQDSGVCPPMAPRIYDSVHQLGTLGGGNHFVEVCLDEADRVWVMLHSGSRGIGNLIARQFIKAAKDEMARYHIKLVDPDLAYLVKGTEIYNDYVFAMWFAQEYARINREIMMNRAIGAVLGTNDPALDVMSQADLVINCHHNYSAMENHFGTNVMVTRKGACRARDGDLAVIPGSMGAKSFVVMGKGHPQSFKQL